MKQYNLKEYDLQNWLLTNKHIIHYDILQECENAVIDKNIDPSAAINIQIAHIMSNSGEFIFTVNGIQQIIESLTKSMNYFASVENYECAARSRDCIQKWNVYLKK